MHPIKSTCYLPIYIHFIKKSRDLRDTKDNHIHVLRCTSNSPPTLKVSSLSSFNLCPRFSPCPVLFFIQQPVFLIKEESHHANPMLKTTCDLHDKNPNPEHSLIGPVWSRSSQSFTIIPNTLPLAHWDRGPLVFPQCPQSVKIFPNPRPLPILFP